MVVVAISGLISATQIVSTDLNLLIVLACAWTYIITVQLLLHEKENSVLMKVFHSQHVHMCMHTHKYKYI